jgi:cytoskeletal protein CcmA (bactofilin family)
MVSNSAIHHGLGFGIQIEDSANVVIQNTIIFDFVKFGFNVKTSKNITVDGNFVGYIHSRHLKILSSGDPQGAFLACAQF